MESSDQVRTAELIITSREVVQSDAAEFYHFIVRF